MRVIPGTGHCESGRDQCYRRPSWRRRWWVARAWPGANIRLHRPKPYRAGRQAHREELDKAKTLSDKLKLAGQWSLAATDLDDEAVERYVLKMLAAETAAQAGDATLAFKYAQDIDAAYTIDVLALKLDLLGKAAKVAGSRPQQTAVATQARILAAEAAAADRYEEANQAGDLGIGALPTARATGRC